jgi:superfamily II DNA or RNA helicase
MVFAVDRAHAAKLHDEFASIGVRSAYIDAYTDMAERDAVKALFHRGEIKVVCSVLTMIAGIDWDVRCISFARPSLSPILFVQAFGRGLRTADGKDHLLFLDHSGVIKAMGLPTNIHFDELRSGKRAKRGSEPVKKKLPSPRECPDCGQIVPAMERNCDCGHVFKFRSTVKTIEGELEEVGADATKTQRKNNRVLGVEEKARFHGELKHYASAHGHLPGWASHKYKDRFGVWPNDPVIKWAAQRPPSLDTLIWLRGQITRNAIARRYAHA